ncbi:LysR family transcriptional regulator [Paenibacillus sp. XY044]|uniref:LysR family transcriptional regulator n=1 Tax=Paenibacillus sp. XY044 TaxID=2026089 RepID=UPI0015C68937|nr:LysR family transcriptional regulator [Paenibacillus sp. XY044]
MNTEKLEYLVEVARAGSISKAAEQLHVTISAVSQAIASLELEWGIIIFKRSKSGVTLTPEGKVIIKKTYEMLEKYEDLLEAARGFSGTVKGRLRVATIPSPMSLLERVVIEFKKKFPDVKLEIVEKGSQDIIDDVNQDKSDLGLIILFKNRLIERTGLAFERLLPVHMVAGISSSSPLALKSAVRPEELRQQTVVLYNDDYVKWYMDDFQSRYGQVDVLFTTNNRDLILRACMNHGAVTIGLNFSFMNEPAFRRDNIAILDFELPDHGPVYLGVIQRKEKTHSQVSRRFMEWLKHDLEQMGASVQT